MLRKKICCIFVATTLSTMALSKQIEPTFNMIEETSNIGHKINGYKYLCMEEQGNQYDLEDSFTSFFESIGFIILTPEQEDQLDSTEKKMVLYGSYTCNVATNDEGCRSNLSITLRNSSGRIIFSSSQSGYTLFVNPQKGFKKAANKVIEQLKKLNYSFDHTLVELSQNSDKTDRTAKLVHEEKQKIARCMKADSIAVEKIIKYTGLTEEEIDKL